MSWLGLDIDEGPIYQMQRMDRYREVIAQMLKDGLAYPCYMSEEELNALREQQMANKEKPRYNGFWRPDAGKQLPTPPADIKPVIRFKNPIGGSVVWEDAVKGRIEISNDELDDLVIARPDGTPTYNFCVVVDDLDMKITHVIRGDDHVNNTPRQINILQALGGSLPIYAHLPTVLNDQGEKMSKRNGAMSVRDYERDGYMPEAVLNYLARLGWSHGDAEVFTKEQFVEWFDLDHLGKSPAQHNPEKLLWLNHQYIQQADATDLAKRALPFVEKLGIKTDAGPDFVGVVNILKDRANTLIELADGARLFYMDRPNLSVADRQTNIPESIHPVIRDLIADLEAGDGSKAAVSGAFKAVLAKHGLKMPALAMPVRYAMFATTQTPAIDAVISLIGIEETKQRLQSGIKIG
jgi:glutamyl-tRNA synthetase